MAILNDKQIRELVKNNRGLIFLIKREATNLKEYINNLDTILGAKTVVDRNATAEYGLKLENNELRICRGDETWDWYIVDKHPELPMFKVVGLHKKDASKNLVYVVGNNSGEPYLFKIPNRYIEKQKE